MPRREILTLLFWLLLSIFVCVQSWRLGLGRFNSPGSGFLPFGAALVVGILALVLFFKERGHHIAGNGAPLFKGKKVQNVIFILALLFGYPLLLNQLGYFLCTLFFVGSCIRIIGQRQWRVVVIIGISTAIISYLLFDVWLKIQIPEGKWVAQLSRVGGLLWR